MDLSYRRSKNIPFVVEAWGVVFEVPSVILGLACKVFSRFLHIVKSMSPWLGDLSVQSSLLKLLSSAPESFLNIETSASSISQRSQTPVIHFATCSLVHFCGSKKQMYNSQEILACWSFLIHYCALFCCLVSFRATLKPKIASHNWIPLLFCSFPLLGWELSFFSIPTEIKKSCWEKRLHIRIFLWAMWQQTEKPK